MNPFIYCREIFRIQQDNCLSVAKIYPLAEQAYRLISWRDQHILFVPCFNVKVLIPPEIDMTSLRTAFIFVGLSCSNSPFTAKAEDLYRSRKNLHDFLQRNCQEFILILLSNQQVLYSTANKIFHNL